MRPCVYLAGPLTGLHFDEVSKWREYAKDRLRDWGVDAISPLRFKSFLSGQIIQNKYTVHVLTTDRGITTRDRFDVMRADALLVNLLGAEKVSVGTMIEVGWADAHRKPIVVVMEEGNPHDTALLREAAGYIVPTLDEAIEIIGAVLVRG